MSLSIKDKESLYNVRGAWRSVKQPDFFGGAGSGETEPYLFSSKLTEPLANQQGKRVRILLEVQVTNICSNYSIIDRVAP
jgi:hypothetical protein